MWQKKRSFMREDILKIFFLQLRTSTSQFRYNSLSSIAGMSHTICLDEEGPGARLTFRQKKCIFSVDSRGFNFSI